MLLLNIVYSVRVWNHLIIMYPALQSCILPVAHYPEYMDSSKYHAQYQSYLNSNTVYSGTSYYYQSSYPTDTYQNQMYHSQIYPNKTNLPCTYQHTGYQSVADVEVHAMTSHNIYELPQIQNPVVSSPVSQCLNVVKRAKPPCERS
jgi:hypothetical protein